MAIFTTAAGTTIAQASNLSTVKGNSITGPNNWQLPDASVTGDDYWVTTQNLQNEVRPWDQLVLGGGGITTTFPGLWQLEPKVSIRYEVTHLLTNPKDVAANPPKAAPIFDIRLQPKGYDPAVVNATGEIWTGADWQALKSVLPTIAPKKGNSSFPAAFDLIHPMCNLLGINQVIVTSVSTPRITDQTLTIQISFLQYFPQDQIFLNPYAGGGSKNLNTGVDPKKNANAQVQSK